jgi:hypothetical protein
MAATYRAPLYDLPFDQLDPVVLMQDAGLPHTKILVCGEESALAGLVVEELAPDELDVVVFVENAGLYHPAVLLDVELAPSRLEKFHTHRPKKRRNQPGIPPSSLARL